MASRKPSSTPFLHLPQVAFGEASLREPASDPGESFFSPSEVRLWVGQGHGDEDEGEVLPGHGISQKNSHQENNFLSPHGFGSGFQKRPS